ncbi:hypothetical protein [Burkholderia aenigmatica]|uniref:LamG domain-containing protein n=1 Tax=Burkholderia aenigmatica TaxID=2015348 RepID=A0A228I2X9_9BURK|nr:hypothetical protein [Burkholderia aenigmatica]OXI36780.1 hypothetical protein CFB84_32785 [Burkholderia aenigmatica]OXI45875.1 hypothetical protein CFB84_13635 [Burkholderia aenigmatica]
MTLALVSRNASFESNSIGFMPPVYDSSLALWHFLGADAGPLGKNLAIGGADSQVVGTPALASRYASFNSQQNFLQTSVQQSARFTFLLIARSTQANMVGGNLPVFISNYKSPRIANAAQSSDGVSLLVSTNDGVTPNVTNLNFYDSMYDGASGTSTGGGMGVDVTQFGGIGVFRFIAAASDEKTMSIRVSGTGTATYAHPAGLVPDIGSAPLRIGSAVNAFSGSCDIAMVGIYNRVLTAAEIDKSYVFLQAFYAKRGIVI